MKMTFNRRLVLQVLSEPTDGRQPPHSARTVLYTLENALKYKWTGGLYADLKFVPCKQQVYRTLKELWHGGLIVGSRNKREGDNGRLPYWELTYQLCREVDRNEINQTLVTTAGVHGTDQFAEYGAHPQWLKMV
jgi:hypothetical protein